jgi:hypothetical protein
MNRLEVLHNRIDLINVPFTERGSRILLGRKGDRLYLRMAERWEKYGGGLREFRIHPPIIQNFTFVQPDGALLLMETESDPHQVTINTKVGAFQWAFIDPEALIVRLPAGQYGFDFDVEAKTTHTDWRGGVLRGIRNIAYTTNARIVENTIDALPTEGRFRVCLQLDAQADQALILNITPRLGFNRAVRNPAEIIEAARARWEAWLNAPPPVPEPYQDQYAYAWWVMGQGLLNQRYYFSREGLVPSKLHYVGVWLWDQAFHAVAYRHAYPRIAEDQLRIMLDHQQPDGMLPDAVHDEGLVTAIKAPIEGTVTKPPILAWAALKLYETSGNLDFLAEIYDGLIRLDQWWTRDNLNPCGLCEHRHPFSSGLDNSPLFDYGLPVVAPDLNTYLYVQMEAISRMAALLGREADAQAYQAKADAWLQRLIAVLWNEERGWFDFLHDGQPVPVLTPFHLLPLWTGKLPGAMNDRLVAHLTDPATFWTDHPIPSVARSDPTFDPKDMWRGPMWPNINQLFVEGLEKIGRRELAAELRRKTLQTLMQHRDIYEYYDPLTAERPPKAAPIFGWSSAAFIELALQTDSA